jgi:phosphatidylserine/phosphatidylglycerophosphate/cardiolipin synthase-like enzyme
MSHGYSWSSEGEFTIWSSYLNAIKNAKKYIYIEDQYLLTFGYPSYSFSDEARARESDLIWQLGMAALERNVKIVVLVPNVSEDALRGNQEFQRVYGLWIMREIAGPEADIIIATLHNGSSSIYVHSKLMICDDEFVLIGSANFCQRSMTHDGELHIGVVDEKNNFARQLRIALWQEHRGLSSVELPLLEDIDSAYAFFKDFAEKGENAAVSENRLRRYEAQCKVAAPDHRAVISCIDPYAGPPRFLGAE